MRYEVCVDSVDGALAAQRAGAHRVELCAALFDGGLTPTLGTVETTLAAVSGIEVHVIIRPRGGDFIYGPYEVVAMERDGPRRADVTTALLPPGPRRVRRDALQLPDNPARRAGEGVAAAERPDRHRGVHGSRRYLARLVQRPVQGASGETPSAYRDRCHDATSTVPACVAKNMADPRLIAAASRMWQDNGAEISRSLGLPSSGDGPDLVHYLRSARRARLGTGIGDS